MTTKQGTQVTLTIPDGAPPGTLLSVPVRGGAEQIKVRVPSGLGAGSTLIMTQADGSEDWGMKVGKVVPLEEDGEFPTNGGNYPPEDGMAIESYRQGDIGSPEHGLDAAVAFTVRLDTTVGTIDIIVRPDWAPLGTRRFLELAASGDLADLAFYRAISGCIVQFGLPAKRNWPCIPDDPLTGVPFLLGAVSFAAIGENTRRSTLFICIGDMSHMLGQKSWETPIGAVAESSLDVLESIDTSYGDIAEFGGTGPDTSRINSEGTAYLRSNFPQLSYIRSAYPLDWPGDGEDAAPAGGVPSSPSSGEPRHVEYAADPLTAASQAAHEAQLQASQASWAASDAARVAHVEEARRASEEAQAAARAAQAAAQEAQRAAQAMKAAQAQAEQLQAQLQAQLQQAQQQFQQQQQQQQQQQAQQQQQQVQQAQQQAPPAPQPPQQQPQPPQQQPQPPQQARRFVGVYGSGDGSSAQAAPQQHQPPCSPARPPMPAPYHASPQAAPAAQYSPQPPVAHTPCMHPQMLQAGSGPPMMVQAGGMRPMLGATQLAARPVGGMLMHMGMSMPMPPRH